MKHTNYELTVYAESYPELRQAIRTLAEEHDVLGGFTNPVDPEPDALQEPGPSADEREEALDEAPAGAPVDDSVVMAWYHKPDTREVWQEPETGRRKGIYKVDEKTAQELHSKYAAEQREQQEQGEEKTLREPTEDAEDTPADDGEAVGSEEEKQESEAAEEKPVSEAHDPEAVEEEEEPAPAEEPELTLDDVRQAVMEYAKARGATKGKALVEKFGVKKISELSADQYPAIYAEAKGEAA